MADLDAAVFDLDGVLIDSEPIWREAERRVFGALGVHLTDDDCRTTMGLPIRAVVEHWRQRRPWEGAPPEQVAADVVAEVRRLVLERGRPMPGAEHAIAWARDHGLRLAVASSSDRGLIAAALQRLGLERTFAVVRSSQDEEHGKPHPAVFLSAARDLGVPPTRCLVLEDSLSGVIAAKAARMRCVAVPEPGADRRPFAVADVVLRSLDDLDEATWERLAHDPRVP